MNPWLATATAMLAALSLPLLVIVRRDAVDGLVALELTGTVVVLVLVLLAAGLDDPAFADLGLVLAFLTFGGGLVYARFLERWL